MVTLMKLQVPVLIAVMLIGAAITAIFLLPKPTPPVDILYDRSGIATQNGVYFDQILLYSHGSSNVTVVVIIKTALDTTPRISQPVTVCPQCTIPVSIEEVQPPRGQSSDQYPIYMSRLNHPDFIRVEYLSTVLSSGPFDSYMPALGGGIFVICLIILVRMRPLNKRR